MNQTDQTQQWLRYIVATLAYRGGKAGHGLAEEAARRKLGETTRTPLEILGHINDLLDWALELCEWRHVWHDSLPESRRRSRWAASGRSSGSFLVRHQKGRLG